MKAEEFAKRRDLGDDYWGDDEGYPVEDWQIEVANGETRLGYWDWVLVNVERDFG